MKYHTQNNKKRIDIMNIFSKDELRAYLMIYQDSLTVFTTPFLPINANKDHLFNLDTDQKDIVKSLIFCQVLRGIDQIFADAHLFRLGEKLRRLINMRSEEIAEISQGCFDSLSENGKFESYHCFCELICGDVMSQYYSGNIMAVNDFKEENWLKLLMIHFEKSGKPISVDPRRL